jgi:ribose 5-phosphate isomerase B
MIGFLVPNHPARRAARLRYATTRRRGRLRDMRVYLGSDHAGFELKNHLIGWLLDNGHEPVDCGPPTYVDDDDYPPYIIDTAVRVAADRDSLGIVIGGSGNGEQIAANKVTGIRAALAWNDDTATLARQHNDANVVSIGARQHTIGEATRLVEVFLATGFSGEERHVRRLAMVTRYEETGVPPRLPDLGGS